MPTNFPLEALLSHPEEPAEDPASSPLLSSEDELSDDDEDDERAAGFGAGAGLSMSVLPKPSIPRESATLTFTGQLT
jgi:hypothetical protein